MAFPLMENFGVPPAPKGMLKVKLKRIEALKNSELIGKSDPYVKLQIREGRALRSKTIANSLNPVYDESFNLVIDDFAEQKLQLRVYDDEFGWKDELLSVCSLSFVDEVLKTNEMGEEEAEYVEKDFIRNPVQEYDIVLDLKLPRNEPGLIGNAARMFTMTARKTAVLNPAKSLFRKKKKDDNDNTDNTLSKKEKIKEHVMHKSLGKVHLSVKFIPFTQPDEDDDEDDNKATKEKQKQVALLERQVTFKVSDDLKGLVTVQLIRAKNLMHTSGSVDPYVVLHLSDPDPLAPKEETIKSRVVFNDDSPRWGDKYDFVNVSAKSDLFLTVYDKKTLSDGLFSLSLSKSRFSDSLLGKVRVPIYEVARNGSLRDSWVLQEAESGEIELRIDWVTCYTVE